MENFVHMTVKGNRLWAQGESQMIHNRSFQLFRAAGVLEYVGNDILAQLPKSLSQNQHVVFMTEHFMLLNHAIANA